jgi:hypothetical protein
MLIRRHTTPSGLLAFALLASLPSPARAEPLRVDLNAAPPAQVARELTRVLGAPVEVRGGVGRQWTLTVSADTAEGIVERVAALLGGRWRLKLRVQPGPAPGPSPVLERRLSLGVENVSAARAFQLVARDLKAELQTGGDLEKRVGLIALGVPASTILDRIAEQAGAAWSFGYVLEVPEAAPAAAPPAAPEPSVSPSPPLEAPLPAPARVPAPISGPELRAALSGALGRVLRMGPDRRAEAVRDFTSYGEQLFQMLDRLSPAERRERLRFAQPVLTPWIRLYRGLAPDVQKQLAPVTTLLERFLRLA